MKENKQDKYVNMFHTPVNKVGFSSSRYKQKDQIYGSLLMPVGKKDLSH